MAPQQDKRPAKKRSYPPFYEKVVPIALGIIALAIIVLLILSAAVALGVFSGGG
jgi:hypothetical protein